jgi:hypothetical protein
MKTESIAEFRKRGGTVKILPTRKARGLEVKKHNTNRHMSTKKTTHVWWHEKQDVKVEVTNEL